MRAKPCASARLSRAERLNHHPPEVVIKVILPGSDCIKAIHQHLVDLQRGHGRSLETDFFNNPIVGRRAVTELIDDWALDLDELMCRGGFIWDRRRRCKKLVHKIIFSMPAGTHPDKLLFAVRDFGQAVFAPGYRYALALHTDEPHPHVHVVVKALSELESDRLHIRKATLHGWRLAFARHLRNHGVAAKASRRSSRRQDRVSKLKGIYRPIQIPHPTTTRRIAAHASP